MTANGNVAHALLELIVIQPIPSQNGLPLNTKRNFGQYHQIGVTIKHHHRLYVAPILCAAAEAPAIKTPQHVFKMLCLLHLRAAFVPTTISKLPMVLANLVRQLLPRHEVVLLPR